jgi:diguanylate cyclase (GGDEF)-like protein
MARDDDRVAAEWVVFRDLTTAGRSADVIDLADRIVAESGDPARVAQALIEKLVALLNLRETYQLGPLLDEITAALRVAPSPRLIGEFHAMSGLVANEQGSLSMAVTHLVKSERALRRMTEVNLAAVDTWHDLSVAFSELGFHHKALEAMWETRRICSAAGLPSAISACLETLVRAAVNLDHQGSTDACVRELLGVIRFGRETMSELVLVERVFLRYAACRLATLGQPADLPDPIAPPEESDIDGGLNQVIQLSAVCDAIATGQPGKALVLLDTSVTPLDMLGVAEPLRLRSIALSRLGDHEAALEVERAILRIVTAEERTLRDRFTDSIGARLDQDKLRRVAAQHANAALSDPLTGLPNRRRIDTFVAGLTRRRVGAIIGALDLDGFKTVNDTHGHPSGDLVLQRLAALLAQAVRQTDLLARYGGDEFVLILPNTTLEEAKDIEQRITGAVDNEDWEALVPGTPVTASIGWAQLPTGGDVTAALHAADEALYRVKRARAAESGPGYPPSAT